MSRTAMALLGLALLISVGQWLFTVVAAHVDLLAIPSHARRHVVRVAARSTRVQEAAAAMAVVAVIVQVSTAAS